MALKFKDYVDKAKREGGTLEITFIRIQDNQPRTVIYDTEAPVGYRLKKYQEISPRTLKKIEKNHDRVYVQDVKWVDSLFTFPEKLTEHSTNYNDKSVHRYNEYDRTMDSTEFQWRSLYAGQIREIKYNGEVIISVPEDQMFDFSFITQDEKVYTSITAAEYERMQREIQQKEYERVKRRAEYELARNKARELAKTLTPGEVGVSIGMANGWSYDNSPATVRRLAIQIKHAQLAHSDPDHHHMYEQESYHAQMHGFHHLKCDCGFEYGWDSSD